MSERREGLLPCPFCGNEHPEITSGDTVVCTNGERWASNLFEEWNRRTPEPVNARLLAAAKKVVGDWDHFGEIIEAAAELRAAIAAAERGPVWTSSRPTVPETSPALRRLAEIMQEARLTPIREVADDSKVSFWMSGREAKAILAAITPPPAPEAKS